MRKFRSIVAFFMVILIQITPWPLGLRPAHAVAPLAVMAVGGIIAAAGAVAGSAIYATPTASGTFGFGVNASTGYMTLPVVVGAAIGNAIYGYPASLGLDFPSFAPIASANPTVYPVISAAVQAAIDYATYTPSNGFTYKPAGTIYKATLSGSPLSSWNGYTTYAIAQAAILTIGGGTYIPGDITVTGTTSGYFYWGFWIQGPTGYGGASQYLLHWTRQYYTAVAQPANTPLTPIPWSYNSQTFAQNCPINVGAKEDAEKLVREHPGVVSPASVPAVVTPGQIAAATAAQAAVAAESAAVAAESAAANDPTNTALQIAAAQARQAAEQAKIVAEGKQAILEATPEEVSVEPDEPDIPYNPDGLDDPYTLPEVDFGQRLKDFVSAVKGTSIFSLPNAVFGNIPGAGNSQMTINGGQIFGTHIFDFADLSSMWLVLRGIVLTGFSFIAVRVVTLKK